jgi:hypothetical protein
VLRRRGFLVGPGIADDACASCSRLDVTPVYERLPAVQLLAGGTGDRCSGLPAGRDSATRGDRAARNEAVGEILILERRLAWSRQGVQPAANLTLTPAQPLQARVYRLRTVPYLSRHPATKITTDAAEIRYL